MTKDKLTEFEQIEYYQKRLKGKTGFTFVMAVLQYSFVNALLKFDDKCHQCLF